MHRLEARCQALPQRRQACAAVDHEKGWEPPTNLVTLENTWTDPQRPHTESQVLRPATVGVSRHPVASIAPARRTWHGCAPMMVPVRISPPPAQRRHAARGPPGGTNSKPLSTDRSRGIAARDAVSRTSKDRKHKARTSLREAPDRGHALPSSTRSHELPREPTRTSSPSHPSASACPRASVPGSTWRCAARARIGTTRRRHGRSCRPGQGSTRAPYADHLPCGVRAQPGMSPVPRVRRSPCRPVGKWAS